MNTRRLETDAKKAAAAGTKWGEFYDSHKSVFRSLMDKDFRQYAELYKSLQALFSPAQPATPPPPTPRCCKKWLRSLEYPNERATR